jgi:hypothetical protein
VVVGQLLRPLDSLYAAYPVAQVEETVAEKDLRATRRTMKISLLFCAVIGPFLIILANKLTGESQWVPAIFDVVVTVGLVVFLVMTRSAKFDHDTGERR